MNHVIDIPLSRMDLSSSVLISNKRVKCITTSGWRYDQEIISKVLIMTVKVTFRENVRQVRQESVR